MLSKIIFNIGQKLRNPALSGWSLFLKKSTNFSTVALEKYQLEQLQKLVKIAYAHSNYYRQSMDAVGIQPQNIQTLEDLKKLPIITKNELIANNDAIHTHLKFAKSFKCRTSGTSGEALTFVREETADSFNRATIFRGYSWYGVQPWEKNGYFWGYGFTSFSKIKTKLLDALQHRFRLFSFDISETNNFLKKLENARFLHGYSSSIYQLACLINEKQFPQKFHLKMVKGTSEKIFDSYQSAIKKAFGVKMISEYGAAETGIIAFECPHGNMHLNMEGVLVEEIDNEIIVTNLQMHAFPIIRYKLGDYIKLASKDKKCGCGMEHKLLDDISGRVGAIVYGKSATYPSLYFYYIFKNLSKKELLLTYQIQQKQQGELLILIEETLSISDTQLLQQEIERYFKKDMYYTIQSGHKISSEGKKQKSFISTITI